MVMEILAWIGVIAFIVVCAKVYEYFKDKKHEKRLLEEDVRNQRLEIARLKGTINGQCPDCGKEKTEEFICSCGFAYVDGNYCFSCDKYYPYSQLEKGMNMKYPHDPYIYECKVCKGNVFKPVDRST